MPPRILPPLAAPVPANPAASRAQVLFDAGTSKKLVHYTLLRLHSQYPKAEIVYFVVGTTTSDAVMSWDLAIDLVMMHM